LKTFDLGQWKAEASPPLFWGEENMLPFRVTALFFLRWGVDWEKIPGVVIERQRMYENNDNIEEDDLPFS
jgi:hypothetical protein